MIDKLKALGSSVKDLALYLVLPLVFLAGYIYTLLTKNRNLKDEVTGLKTATKAKEDINAANQAEKESDSAVSDYKSAFQQYISSRSTDLRSSPDKVRPGSEDSGEDDSTKGSSH